MTRDHKRKSLLGWVLRRKTETVGQSDRRKTKKRKNLHRRALITLDFLTALVSPRTDNEVVGDAAELINRWIGENRSPILVYTKLASTMFWCLVFTLGEIVKELSPWARGSSQEGDEEA